MKITLTKEDKRSGVNPDLYKIVPKTAEDLLREQDRTCERCHKGKAIYLTGNKPYAICDPCYQTVSMY